MKLVTYNSKNSKIDEINCNYLELEDIHLDEYSFKNYLCIEPNTLLSDFEIEVEKVTENNIIICSTSLIFNYVIYIKIDYILVDLERGVRR